MMRVLGQTQNEEQTKNKAVLACAYSASGGVSDLENAPKGSVAVVALRGVVMKYGGYYSPGSKDYVSLLNAIYGDSRFVGTVFCVDSPGGMAAGTRELFEAVANPAKPVVAMIDSLAASAAYYAIAGANAIYATQPNDMVGSIGTYAALADYKTYFEKQGLPIYEIYASQSTEKNLETRELFSEKKDALLKAQLTASNQIFIDDVKLGRGEKLNLKAGDPFKGGLYLAKEATEMGLIDGTSKMNDALAEVTDRFKISKRKSITMNLVTELQSLLGRHQPEAESAVSPELIAAQATIETLNGELATVRTESTALTARVATLETELATERAEVIRLGNKPGEKPTAKRSESNVEGDGATQTPQQIIDALPHNQFVDSNL